MQALSLRQVVDAQEECVASLDAAKDEYMLTSESSLLVGQNKTAALRRVHSMERRVHFLQKHTQLLESHGRQVGPIDTLPYPLFTHIAVLGAHRAHKEMLHGYAHLAGRLGAPVEAEK